VIAASRLPAPEGLVTLLALAGRHAAKVIHLDVVIVRAGREPRAGTIKCESRDGLIETTERKDKEEGRPFRVSDAVSSTTEKEEGKRSNPSPSSLQQWQPAQTDLAMVLPADLMRRRQPIGLVVTPVTSIVVVVVLLRRIVILVLPRPGKALLGRPRAR